MRPICLLIYFCITVNQLRACQDRVLNEIQKIMDDAIPGQRANRDFRVKFPDDVLQESLAGQLWFGAEVSAIRLTVLASDDFCHLLITFTNSLNPDQDRENVGPDLDPNCLTL